MKTTDFHNGDIVAYIPTHAYGDLEHPDVECGVVSSISSNEKNVFVKYFPALKRFGWTGCTSQATSPDDLILLGRPSEPRLEIDRDRASRV